MTYEMNSNLSEAVFVGDSEMATLMRSLDWSQTPLGPVSEWAQSLKTSVSILLNSRCPMCVWWGQEYVNLYNDAYCSMLGASKHPQFLGQSARNGWADEWNVVGPLADSVFATGQPAEAKNFLLIVDRNGHAEEAYFTFSYSPVHAESGGVGGIFCTVTETTQQIVGERRLRTLRELNATVEEAKTVEEACHLATVTLSANAGDISFALMYQVEPNGTQARLVSTTSNLGSGTVSPHQVDLTQASDLWKLSRVNQTREPELIEDFALDAALPGGVWSNSARAALVMPIARPGQAQCLVGFLVVGVSPRRVLDDEYRDFFELVCSQVACAIAHAEAYEAERECAAAPAELEKPVEATLKLAQFRRQTSQRKQHLQLEAENAEQTAEIILSSISDGFFTLDRNWCYTYANDRLCEMAGKSREELIGYNNWEVFPEAVDTDVYFQFQRSFREQVPLQFEYLYSPWNRWFEYRVYPSPDGLTIFAIEVSDRKHAELVLVEQKQLLELIALGRPLEDCLAALCAAVSRLNPCVRACILLADDQGLTFPHSITPHFSPSFGQGLKHVPINELCIGTCGEAVYSGQPVTCADIASDNRWSQEWRDLCLAHGVLACHSVPVLGIGNQPFGSLMLCFDQARMPTDWEYRLANFGTQVASIVLERDRANAALRESETRFRRVFECNMVPMGIWSQSGSILHANDALLSLVGYTQQELEAGRVRWQSLTPPEWTPLDERALEEVMARGVIAPYEKEYVHKQGHRIPILAGGASFLEDSNSGIFFAIDLRANKQAEAEIQSLNQALANRVNELQALFDLLPIGVAIAEDPQCSMIRANPCLAKMLRVPAGANASQSAPSHERPAHRMLKGGQEVPVENLPMQYAAMQGVDVRDEVVDIVHPDGTVIKLLCYASPLLDDQGQVRGALGVFVDITQRVLTETALRESEERLLFALAVARMVAWEWNLKTGVSERLGNAAELMGLDSSNVGDFYQRIHPEDRAMVEAAVAHTMRSGDPYELEFRLLTLEGRTLWMADKARLRYDAEGNPSHLTGVCSDITERKQTEAALHQSEERLRLAVIAARMVAWTWSASTQQIVRSETASDILGLSPEATTSSGEDGWALVHPDDLPMHQARVADAIANRRSFLSEFRMIRPDTGAVIWVEDRGQVSCDQQGNLISIDGILFDITDRKQAEVALRESEEKYRLLFESIDEGFCIVEVIFDDDENPIDYRFLIANPAFEKQTGHKNVVGKTVRQIVSHHEDCWFERYGKVALTGESIRVEDCFEGFHGWYEVHAFRIGKPEHRRVGTLLTNVTDRKQAEEELQQKNAILNAINESTPTPIFVKDRQGRIIYANPATLEVLGRPAAEVIGYRDCDLYPHAEDAARVMENDRRIMESGQLEVVEESPDGIRTFLGMKVPYRNQWGEVIGLIGISNDISERVQIERARESVLQQEQAARKAAEEANRIKDEFLAVLSHELRSPLNPILGWSRLLQSGKLDETRTEQALATIERNAKLQAELIEDLLDVSRILRGKLSLTINPINPAAVIQAAIETVRLAAEAKSIQIKTQLDGFVGLVLGDSTRLQQVIWNLLSNAVKFTPTNGQVTVQLENLANQAQITVTDTGKGIAPDFLPHVFDYFRQEDGATTRKFGGLGLGLAIVRHLVELHGGTIRADSPGEGLGATFAVQLPLASCLSPTSPNHSQPSQSPNLKNIKVLVVDDEKDSRDFVAFLLEQEGATVTTAASASEALAVINRCQFDILLSDIGMPDMNGYTLVQQVRSLPSEQGGAIPAIALTAYAGEYDQRQALKAGFQKHISKPIEPEFLVKVISQFIRPNKEV